MKKPTKTMWKWWKRVLTEQDYENAFLYMPNTEYSEFVKIMIDAILGENWYVADPMTGKEVNTVAIYEILKKLGYKFK